MNLSKLIKISIGFSLFMGVASLSQAAVITSVEGTEILTSQVVGATTIDFEGLGSIAGTSNCPVDYICDGDYQIRTSDGNVNQSAAPYQATPVGGDWLTVPNPISHGSAMFTLGANYDYFGLFWGSLDTYNSIEFFDGSTSLATFSGGFFMPPLQADGGQGDWDSNRYINFMFTDGMTYNGVELVSDGFAFESDNHAYGNVSPVPAPAAVWLFGTGLIGLVGFGKRRKAA
jgi:hypothetical protein